MTSVVALPGRQAVERAGAVVAVMATVLGMQVAYGTELRDGVVFLAYQLGFGVLPGLLVYRALSSRRADLLREFAMGWSLGYGLQVIAFMATAALGVRGLFTFYPLIVGLPAALVVRRREAPVASSTPIPWQAAWLTAAVAAVAVVYIAGASFPQNALPGTQTIHGHQDFPWAMSLVGEAKNHWPITDPQVSGLPLPYHFFVHIHMAGASQVTGLAVPVILLRLYLPPIIVLAVLNLVVAGRSVTQNVYAGVGAAGLALVVAEMSLVKSPFIFYSIPFAGVATTHLWFSPSVPFGLVFLIPLLVLLGDALTSRRSEFSAGDWLLVLLLMVGASDAKVIILPMIAAALALYCGITVVFRRIIAWSAVVAGGLAGLVFGVVWLIQYRGHTSGVELDGSAAWSFFNGRMAAVLAERARLLDSLPDFFGRGFVVSVVGVLTGAVGLFGAQLVGIAWLLRGRFTRLTERELLFGCFLAVGVLAVLVGNSPATANISYFLDYGLLAGCVLAAAGWHRWWEERQKVGAPASLFTRAALAGCAISGLLLLGVGRVGSDDPPDYGSRYLVAFGLLAGIAVCFWAIGRFGFRQSARVSLAPVAIAMVVTGALDAGFDASNRGFDPVAERETGRRLTPDLHAALVWVRDNTPGESVLAVNNAEALEFIYAGHAERRTFLGGWGYSAPTRASEYAGVSAGFVLGAAGTAGVELYADRLALNDAVFRDVDPGAVAELQEEYGVGFLVIDLVNGFEVEVEDLMGLGRVVHESDDGVVIELDPAR